MRTPPPPPRRLPAAARRKQLVAVALEAFAAGSYHATSMDDIAERAGVTKPVLYQHFPSKSRLYLELIETVGEELRSSVASSATAESQPRARVLAGFRAYFRFVATRSDAFRLLFGGGARQGGEFADAVRAVERSVAETIAGLIDVDLDVDHRELLGYAIVGLAEVTARQWVLRHDESAAEAAPWAAVPDGVGPTTTRADPSAGTRPMRTGSSAGLVVADGDVLAVRLADLIWAGLRGLPSLTPAGEGPGTGRIGGSDEAGG